jgi:hypothetical protein
MAIPWSRSRSSTSDSAAYVLPDAEDLCGAGFARNLRRLRRPLHRAQFVGPRIMPPMIRPGLGSLVTGGRGVRRQLSIWPVRIARVFHRRRRWP